MECKYNLDELAVTLTAITGKTFYKQGGKLAMLHGVKKRQVSYVEAETAIYLCLTRVDTMKKQLEELL